MTERQIAAVKRVAANFAATVTVGLLIILAFVCLVTLASL